MNHDFIPVMKPTLATFSQLENYLRRIDECHVYSNHGPLVHELEDAYAKYLGTEPELVVAIANATLALQGLLSISNLDDWLLPNYTFAASGLAVLNAKKNLFLCDVDSEEWKIDIAKLDDSVKDFGMMPVMPFGSQVDFVPYSQFKTVIVDAAASLGQTPPDFKAMNPNWAVVYSLHATKVLGAGEGALAICGSLEMAKRLRAWINFGFQEGRISSLAGTNAKMSEVNAAYGLHSITNLENEKKEWLVSQEQVAIWGEGREWNSHINQIASFQPYWIAQFRNKKTKIAISKVLATSGIQSREWWATPLSTQETFKHTPLLNGSEISEFLSETSLGLPMFRGLTMESIRRVINIIDESLLIL